MTKADKSRPDYIYYSPVEADNFEGLPPAYIETAEFDCLHDDGETYIQWNTSRKTAYFSLGCAAFVFACAIAVFFIK